MSKDLDISYGVTSILFGTPPANGAFPAIRATENVHKITHISIDSVTPNQDDDTTADVDCEDLDATFLVLTSKKGKKTITFRSYNYSEGTYEFFLGYEKQADGSLIEIPNYEIPTLYMEVETRDIGQFKGNIEQFTPCKVTVKETGVYGKSGLKEIEFKVERLANINAAGKEIGGKKVSKKPEDTPEV